MSNSRYQVSSNGVSGRHQTAGFTLIELLIALTVLVLLVGVLFAGLRMGDRAWRAVDEKSSELTEMRLVWGYMDNRIRDFKPVYHESDQGMQILFSGTSDAIEFLTTSSYQNGFGGYYIVRLQLIPDQNGAKLAIRQWLYQPSLLEGTSEYPAWTALSEGGGAPPQLENVPVNAIYSEAVLLDDVDTFKIEYLGALDGEETEEWHSQWREKIHVPSLIRMNIKRGGKAWPELFFVPVSSV